MESNYINSLKEENHWIILSGRLENIIQLEYQIEFYYPIKG